MKITFGLLHKEMCPLTSSTGIVALMVEFLSLTSVSIDYVSPNCFIFPFYLLMSKLIFVFHLIRSSPQFHETYPEAYGDSYSGAGTGWIRGTIHVPGHLQQNLNQVI